MAFIQNVKPPPNRIHTFSLRDFSGGMNNVSQLLEDNESPHILNLMWKDATILTKRMGSELYEYDGATITHDAPITYMNEYYPYTDDRKLFTSTDDTVYVNGEVLQSVAGRVDGTTAMSQFFFVDGDKLFTYGQHPTTTSTFTGVVGTPPTGYSVLEVVSPPTGYTPLPEPNVRGFTQYDYNAGTVYYEPCEYELESPYLGANVVPDNPSFIELHKGRLFVSGVQEDNDNVFITDVNRPFYFPVYLPLQLPPNDDEVKGMIVFDDAMVVARREDMYLITGSTNNPDLGLQVFSLNKLNTHTGVANNQCMHVGHNYLMFVGHDGNMYGMSSAYTDGRLATQIISQQLNIFDDPIGLTNEQLRGAVAFFHKDYFYVSIADKVLVYYYRNRGWAMWDSLHIRSFFEIEGELVFGDESGRLTHFTDDTRLDYGRPYVAHWESKYFDMNDANSFKQFREFYLVLHTFEKFFSDVRVTFMVDYTNVDNEISVKNTISRFGKSLFGDRFINRTINASAPNIVGRRARLMKFVIENGYTSYENVLSADALPNVLNKKNFMSVYVEDEGIYYYYKDGDWFPLTLEEYNQSVLVYQINGDYEFRGKR
jgi:hypothetical protein